MKHQLLKSLIFLPALIALQTGCTNRQQKQEAIHPTTKDTLWRTNIDTNRHGGRLSLKDINTLLEGTWASAGDDTTPYYYEIYKNGECIITEKYMKDTIYFKEPYIRNYCLSFKPATIPLVDGVMLDEGYSQVNSTACLCYLILQTVSDSNELHCQAILRITKDSLYTCDGEKDWIATKVK